MTGAPEEHDGKVSIGGRNICMTSQPHICFKFLKGTKKAF